jgi:uncharacterized protein with PIN domain
MTRDSLGCRGYTTDEECLVKDIVVKLGQEGSKPFPLCPHCSGELSNLNVHRGKLWTLVELHVVSCPHCRKVLEVRYQAK